MTTTITFEFDETEDDRLQIHSRPMAYALALLELHERFRKIGDEKITGEDAMAIINEVMQEDNLVFPQ